MRGTTGRSRKIPLSGRRTRKISSDIQERMRERKREKKRESSERSSTCANCGERSPEWGMLRRHCVKATTSTTWPDGWERYDGTGAARNFLDNIGRSGRATGANADAYVSGGATRIRAVGACPSRSPPASRRRRTVHPLSWLSLAHRCSPIISLWP